jgi:hypothetical protein
MKDLLIIELKFHAHRTKMNFIGGSRAHYTMTPPYTS